MLDYVSMGQQQCFSSKESSIRHYNKSLTMKTTTNTVKIHNFKRKVREESVGAI